MKWVTLLSCATLPATCLPGRTEAAIGPDRWFVHVGPARLAIDGVAHVGAAGQPVPGAAVRIRARYTPAIEIGTFVSRHVSVSGTAGLPFGQGIDAAGTLRPYGRLGSMTYGPAALAVQWHPFAGSPISPHVGVGAAYMHVFATHPGSLRNLHAEDDAGPIVQGGAELRLGRGLGLFADAKKAFLRTRASGLLGEVPISARLRLDPLVLHAGIAVHF